MTGEDLDFDFVKSRDDILIAAAKAAHGYVYYESKLTRKKTGGIRVDIYEKYARPSRKHAAMLKEQGVEWVVHDRS